MMKYEGKMKKYEGKMKKYEGKMKKYEEKNEEIWRNIMKEIWRNNVEIWRKNEEMWRENEELWRRNGEICSSMEKFWAFQQEGGNLTPTQFLRWPPVPKGKAGLPPKKGRYAEILGSGSRVETGAKTYPRPINRGEGPNFPNSRVYVHGQISEWADIFPNTTSSGSRGS